VVEPRADREGLARRCGASVVLTPDQAAAEPNRFDLVVEAAGAPGAARLAVSLARRGGRVVLTGLPAVDDRPLSATDLVLDEITVHTVFGAPSRAWSHAVRAFVAGALDPAVVVTHELPLDQVGDAFALLADEQAGAIKVLLRP
jgi:threonine dehydrogenase-like Zn-dependent dehydrogenase